MSLRQRHGVTNDAIAAAAIEDDRPTSLRISRLSSQGRWNSSIHYAVTRHAITFLCSSVERAQGGADRKRADAKGVQPWLTATPG
jgi:hypothetical protein